MVNMNINTDVLIPKRMRGHFSLSSAYLILGFCSFCLGVLGFVFAAANYDIISIPDVSAVSALSLVLLFIPPMLRLFGCVRVASHLFLLISYVLLSLIHYRYFGISIFNSGACIFLFAVMFFNLEFYESIIWLLLLAAQKWILEFSGLCCAENDLFAGVWFPHAWLLNAFAAVLIGGISVMHLKHIQKQNEFIESLREVDELTGVYNERGMRLLSKQTIRNARRERKNIACIYIDIEGFERISAEHGYQEGNEILVAVAGNLKNSIREVDLVARVGLHEFVVLAIVEHDGDAQLLAQRFLVSVIHFNESSTKPYTIQLNMGIVFRSPEECEDLIPVIHEAKLKLDHNRQDK